MEESYYDQLIAGIQKMLADQSANLDRNLAALEANSEARVLALEEKFESRFSIIEAMFAAPTVTGLPNPRSLQYLVLSFFDNSDEMKRGKGKYVLKIEANRVKKPGHMKLDFELTAMMFDFDKFRKSFKPCELEEKDAVMKRIARFAGEDNVLFGLIRKQGGKAGTARFADQLIILVTDGEIKRPKIISGVLFIGGQDYVVPGWEYADENAWKAANLTSKARCWPSDDNEGGADDVE